jgi:hypothetical protein
MGLAKKEFAQDYFDAKAEKLEVLLQSLEQL